VCDRKAFLGLKKWVDREEEDGGRCNWARKDRPHTGWKRKEITGKKLQD